LKLLAWEIHRDGFGRSTHKRQVVHVEEFLVHMSLLVLGRIHQMTYGRKRMVLENIRSRRQRVDMTLLQCETDAHKASA
jgi:hypothetical protein